MLLYALLVGIAAALSPTPSMHRRPRSAEVVRVRPLLQLGSKPQQSTPDTVVPPLPPNGFVWSDIGPSSRAEVPAVAADAAVAADTAATPVAAGATISTAANAMRATPLYEGAPAATADGDATAMTVPPQYPSVPPLRECFSFAVPALGIYAAPTLMSLIDAAFIGRVSTTELAALGPAGSISDSMPFFLLFISIAATNLVAKSHRKDDNIGSARIARTTVTMGGLGGALLCVVTVLAARALSTLYCGSNAAVLAPLCAKYVLVRALALPAVVVATVAQGLCIGIKDTKTPMLAVAVSAALNFFGDLLFVGGLSMGIAGAAWATTISQYCAAVLLLRVLAGRGLLTPPATITKRAATAATPARSAAPQTTPATIRAVLSFLPFLFVMSVKVSMHNACSATAATLGGAAAAAHTALMAVAWLCFTFGDVGSSLAQAYLPAFASEAAEAKPEEAPPSAPASGDGTSGEGTATSELLQYVYPDGVAAAEGGGTAPSAPATKPLGRPTFDMVAAWPTIAQLLRCTLTISATVIAMATLLLSVFAGQISSDVAVQRQMRAALPLVVGTLSTHGTAVTLEGLLLAQKNFRGLGLTYVAVALSVGALLALVRTSGAGLLGVWGVYGWYCAFRVVAFSAFGGLLDQKKAKAHTSISSSE